MKFGPHGNFKRFYQGESLHSIIQRKVRSSSPCPFLIENVSDSEQVFGRPEMDIDFFGRPGIGMAQDCADELDRDAFYVQNRAEIMTECMRAEPRYAGSSGKFFTEAVQAVS